MSNFALNQHERIDIAMFGDVSVGKTSLVNRYVTENFSHQSSLPTIGVDYKIKNITLQQQKIKVVIWDTAGQEKYRSLSQQYYSKANGIALVYAVDDQGSFDSINNWIKSLQEHSQGQEEKPVILIANKTDNEELRVVSSKKGEKLATQFSIPFKEVSALTGDGVDSAFKYLVKQIFKAQTLDFGKTILKKDTIKLTRGQSIALDFENRQRRKKCCK